MPSRRHVAIAGLFLAAAARPAAAHPHEALGEERSGAIEQQVMAFRKALAAAILRREGAALRAAYAQGFTHTHPSGRVDGRDAHIAAVLAGGPALETARVDELGLRILGPDAVVATGRSPLADVADPRDADVRWMAVYARIGGDWRLAASQATRIAPSA